MVGARFSTRPAATVAALDVAAPGGCRGVVPVNRTNGSAAFGRRRILFSICRRSMLTAPASLGRRHPRAEVAVWRKHSVTNSAQGNLDARSAPARGAPRRATIQAGQID